MQGPPVVVGFYLLTGLLQLAFSAVLLLRPPRREWAWVLAGLFACNGAAATLVGAQWAGWIAPLPRRRLFETFDQATLFLLAYLALAFPTRPGWAARRPWILPALLLTPLAALALCHLAGWDGAFFLARSPDTPLDLPRLLVGFALPAAAWSVLVVRWTAAWRGELSPEHRLQLQLVFAAFGMRAASQVVSTGVAKLPGADPVLLALAQASNAVPLLVLLGCLVALLRTPERGRRRKQTLFVAGFLLVGLFVGSTLTALGPASGNLRDLYSFFDLYALRPAVIWLAMAHAQLLGPSWRPNRLGAFFVAALVFAALSVGVHGAAHQFGDPWATLATLVVAASLTAVLVRALWPSLTGRVGWIPDALEPRGRLDWLPGDEVLGRYRVEALLGEGTAGGAYLAHDRLRGHNVVLKRTLRLDPDKVRLLLHEARALERLDHPRLMRLLDVEQRGGEPVLVLEHMPAGSLQGRLCGRPLPVREAVAVALDVLAALEASHAVGILHRDVKPSNILLDARGRAKLADFGVARLPASDLLLGHATVDGSAGSPRYMSPEQVRGLEADERSDLFAVAIVLHEMLGGRHPVPHGAGDYEVRRAIVEGRFAPLPARIPAALAGAVRRGLHTNPARRYASARAFSTALLEAYPARKTRVERPTPTTSPVASA